MKIEWKPQLSALQFKFDFPNLSIFYNLQSRVVSNLLKLFWAAKSPDLNLLDFLFWVIPERSVYDSKPRSLQQLKKIVELCARNVSRVTLIKAAQDLRKKSHLMLGKREGPLRTPS